MAFWIWAVAGMVFGLMLYEIISWIKKKIHPPEDMTEEARAESDRMQAELTRANMKIAVLESRLEEAKLEREAETTALEQQHKEQQAKTEAAYQRQMITMSERMAANGQGDWRAAVQREKEQKLAAQDKYPVRMAVEIAAWQATTLGEEPGVDTAVSEGPIGTTKENNEEFDAHDPAVNTLSEETAVPNLQSSQPAPETEAGDNEIAAAVAAISGLELTEISTYSDDLQDAQEADGDAPGEQRPEVQTNGSNGKASGAPQTFYDEEPVDIGVWLDDRDQEVMDQITVLDETEQADSNSPDGDMAVAIVIQDDAPFVEENAEAVQPAVDLAAEMNEEPPAVYDDGGPEMEEDSYRKRKLALMAGLAVGTVVVERPFEGEAISDDAADELPSEIAAEADDTPVGAAVADDEAIAAYEDRWPDLEGQAMQRAKARQLGSEMDADYLDDEEFLREMGIEQTAPQQELLSGAEAEENMGAENWVVDPIEELANHINGEDQSLPESPQDEDISDAELSGPQIEVADHLWEEMVYAGAEATRAAGGENEDSNAIAEIADDSEAVENDQDGTSEPVDTAEEDDVLLVEETDPASLDGVEDEEDAVIAATVAAILSRAPEGQEEPESDPDWEPVAQQQPENGGSDGGFEDVAPIDEDPLAGVPLDDDAFEELDADNDSQERPSADWQRQPVLWQAEYYDNTKLADAPVVVRQDQEINFQWRDRAPAQGIDPRTFSVRWSSRLPLEEGQYRFTASAPDGMRLWLNDRLVISAWYDQSEQTYQRDFSWRGGSIDVRVEHYENGGDAKAFLTWDRVA